VSISGAWPFPSLIRKAFAGIRWVLPAQAAGWPVRRLTGLFR